MQTGRMRLGHLCAGSDPEFIFNFSICHKCLHKFKSIAFVIIYLDYLEKEMATHSSVLAWRIPGTGEPGGLPSMGSHGVGHD